MIATTLFAALLAQQERPAIKEILPNGATVYAQKMADASTFSIVLASVPRGEPETPETHGVRHLAEHLIAKGAKKTIDAALESHGLILLASTTRDAMTFQVTGATKDLGYVLSVMPELFGNFEPTDAEIKKEIGLIEEELALRQWDSMVVSDGWTRVYGERALDPFGDPERLRALNVDGVRSAILRVFRPENMCITLVGDFDASLQISKLKELVGGLKKDAPESIWVREGSSTAVRAGSSDGEMVCVPVSPFTDNKTLATLGAGFGLRAWVPKLNLHMNPSPRNGLVTVSLPTGYSWPATASRYAGRESLIGQTGLVVLRAWLHETSRDPARLAKLSAVMFGLNPSFDPQTLDTLADQVSPDDVTREVRGILTVGGAKS